MISPFENLILDIDSRIKDESTRQAVINDDYRLHHTLGMWARNHYKLWDEKSEYYKLFNSLFGLNHADDMWGIIQGFYKAYLTDTTYDPWPDVDKYKAHWASSSGT